MKKLIGKIICEWNSRGEIHHKITFGSFPTIQENDENMLAPTLPVLISHQLGAFRPSYGLILCTQIIDYFIDKKHVLLPINTALKYVEIDWYETDRKNVLNYHPQGKFLANNDSLEEGSRQFVNNYMLHVATVIPSQTLLITRGFVWAVVNHYHGLIQKGIKQGFFGPNKDKWNINMSVTMETMSEVINKRYGPKCNSDDQAKKLDEIFCREAPTTRKFNYELCKAMGIMR